MSVPTSVDLDPQATAASAFLVRATRVREGATPTMPEGEQAQQMSCTLQSSESIVATGTLRVQPGRDDTGAVTRISSGTVELNYKVGNGGR